MAKVNFDASSITSSINNFLINNTPIAPVNQGSLGKVIVDSTVSAMSKGFSSVDAAMADMSPLSAIGPGIDFWGGIAGKNRLPARSAEVSSLQRNIMFYTLGGKTFGDINNNQPITIPAGTLVYSSSPIPQGGNVVYRTTSATILLASENQGYASAVAFETGVAYNIPSGTLRFHNFKNYAAALSESLRVTNTTSITSARSTESDPDFKRRVLNVFRGEEDTIPEMLNIVRSLTNVSDVIYIPNIDGLGTITLIVQENTPTTSGALISSIKQTFAEKFASEGLVVYIRPPVYVGVGVDITVTHLPSLTIEQKLNIEASLQQTLSSYLNNLRMGDTLSLNSIRRIVSGFEQSFKSIGTSRDVVDAVYIYKDSFGIRAPQKITNDITIGRSEKLVVEYSSTNPINIIRA